MRYRIAGIGEVLWDLLPSGKQLGGAPANFAYHAQSLGANASIITRVGNDEQGREILRRFREMGLNTGTVQIDGTAPTGTAKVQVSEGGAAHFTITEDVAWDRIALTAEAEAYVQQADAVCFGSLAQRSLTSADAIQKLVAAAPVSSLRIFDVNLRQNFYTAPLIERSLALANVFKLNDDELPKLAAMFGLTGSPRDQIEALARKFALPVVALTRGEQGSLLFQNGRWSEITASHVTVVDTVGAGDSFTAALAMGLLANMPLEKIHVVANAVAEYVCTQAGATPPMPSEFAEEFQKGLNRKR